MTILDTVQTVQGAKEFLLKRGMSCDDFAVVLEANGHKKTAKILHTSPNVITVLANTFSIDTKAIKSKRISNSTKAYIANMSESERAERGKTLSKKLLAFYANESDEHKQSRIYKAKQRFANETLAQKAERCKRASDAMKAYWSNLSDTERKDLCERIKAGHTEEGRKASSAKNKQRWSSMTEEQRREFFKDCGFIGEPNSNKLAKQALDELGIEYEQELVVHKAQTSINYRLDFYLPDGNIDLEVDGSIHRKYGRQYKDELRDKYMQSLGMKVIRVQYDGKNETVQSIKQKIVTALESD